MTIPLGGVEENLAALGATLDDDALVVLDGLADRVVGERYAAGRIPRSSPL